MKDTILKGEKVILKTTNATEADHYYRWFCDEEISILAKDTFKKPIRKKIPEWIESRRKDTTRKQLTIYYQDNPIGYIVLRNINKKDGNAGISITIGEKEAWGKGLGQDAVKTLLEYGFSKLNLHRITLSAREDNKRALTCYKKVGFKKEGVFREDVWINGEYLDRIALSILKTEWEKIGTKEKIKA